MTEVFRTMSSAPFPTRAGRAVPVLLLAACLGLAACAEDGAPPPPDVPPQTVLFDEPGTYIDLEFSPDGGRITYALTQGTSQAIWVANADGTDPVRVSEPAPYAINPEWSPDGEWVVYESDLYGPPDIFVAPASGEGDPRRLTDETGLEMYPSWSPDGSRILYRSNEAGNFDLWTVPAEGGEPTRWTTDPGYEIGSFSPTEPLVAFRRDGPEGPTVWLLSTDDGTERQLTNEGSENFSGIWSPDGSEVLYTSFRTGLPDIWSVPVDGGEPRQITRDIRSDAGPRVSPDGRWMAFRSERGAQDDIWIVPFAGGEAVRVTDDPAEESDIRWRPDGRGLVFARSEAVDRVYAYSAADGAARAVTSGAVDQLLEDVSPDGRRVLYTSEPGGSDDLFAVPVDGGEAEAVVAGPVEENGGRWSPDGSRIAHFSSRGGVPTLLVTPVGGGEAVAPTSVPLGGQIFWSPDGARIAFVDAGARALHVVPSGGGEADRITETNEVWAWGWSPDGSSFLYSAPGADGRRPLYRIPAEGGEPVLLTPDISSEARTGAWSPDGSRIAYATHTGEGFDLFVMDADGSGHRQLTTATGWDVDPLWSRDGAEIYFTTDRNGTYDLAAVTLATGEVRIVFEDPGDVAPPLHLSPDGATVYFTLSPVGNEYVTVDVGALLDAAATAEPGGR